MVIGEEAIEENREETKRMLNLNIVGQWTCHPLTYATRSNLISAYQMGELRIYVSIGI